MENIMEVGIKKGIGVYTVMEVRIETGIEA